MKNTVRPNSERRIEWIETMGRKDRKRFDLFGVESNRRRPTWSGFESNLTVGPARFLETREKWIRVGWGRRTCSVAGTFEPALSFTSFHGQTEFDEFQTAMPGIRSFLNTPRRWPFHARQVRDSESLCVWRRLVVACVCVTVLLCTHGNSVTVLIIRVSKDFNFLNLIK